MFSKCDRVQKGVMVVFGRNNSILYAGPVTDVPALTFPEGSLVVMHPEDHETLTRYVEKRRH